MWIHQLKLVSALQGATDEYIEQNDERFSEVAALLLSGRDDLCADGPDASASLLLGEEHSFY